jgi:restriction system protein
MNNILDHITQSFITYHQWLTQLLDSYTPNIDPLWDASILISAHVLIFFVLYILCKPSKENQRYRIGQSRKLLVKLRAFEGVHRTAQTLTYLRKIDPFVFEELLLTALEDQKVGIIRNERYTNDGGIDGRFKWQGKIALIQAKRYQAHINRQHALVFAEQVQSGKTYGIFAHTGRTGKGSFRALLLPNMLILSGDNLVKLLHNEITLDSMFKQQIRRCKQMLNSENQS